MGNCPKCKAPTLDQTSNSEDCESCGYWLNYNTGEGHSLSDTKKMQLATSGEVVFVKKGEKNEE